MNKFLFFDIDGTLTDSDHGIQWPSESTLAAIRKAQAAGSRCLICSGRNLGGLKQYLALNMTAISSVTAAGSISRDRNRSSNRSRMTSSAGLFMT